MKVPANICLMGLILSFGIFAPSLAAEVRPSIEFVYFAVPYMPGKTPVDMILINSPLGGQTGRRHLGETKWRIRYGDAAISRPKIDVCRVENPEVACECIITLPRLEGGDTQVRAAFEKVAAETKEHELEHCRIAVKHADELERAFKSMKDRDCKDIGKAMREIYDKVCDDCSVEQKRFDHAEYGYKQYLYLESLQKMSDAGFNLAPPPEGRSLPQLDRGKNNMTTLPPNTQDLKEQGFYKDENGIWRNY